MEENARRTPIAFALLEGIAHPRLAFPCPTLALALAPALVIPTLATPALALAPALVIPTLATPTLALAPALVIPTLALALAFAEGRLSPLPLPLSAAGHGALARLVIPAQLLRVRAFW